MIFVHTAPNFRFILFYRPISFEIIRDLVFLKPRFLFFRCAGVSRGTYKRNNNLILVNDVFFQ